MNGNGQGHLPEPDALDLESMGYLNGTGCPVHYSNPDNTELRLRFAQYVAAVQAASWGTTERAPNSRYLSLEKLLQLLPSHWQKFGLSYMCHQGSLPTGQVTCRHVWLDTRESGDVVYSDIQVGAEPPGPEILLEISRLNGPQGKSQKYMAPSPQEDGKYRTYHNRRSLMMIHGIWPDEDNDGLTRAELRALTADANGQANGSTRGSGTCKGNGSKAKGKASNGAKAPKAKPIDVLINEDDGSVPGRGDLLRAMKELGVADAAAATTVMKGLCEQQGVAFPPDAKQDPDVFHKLAHAYMEVPA